MQDQTQKDRVRIELTEEQKRQLREVTGRDASRLEFSVEELEERIAPAKMGYRAYLF